MLCLGALTRLARADVLGDVDVLAAPEGQAAHQRPRLGAPKVSPKRTVMTLAEHLGPKAAARGDAKAVRFALSTAVQEAAAHQEHPALRGAGVPGEGRAEPVHELPERRCRAAHDQAEDRVDGQLGR